MVKLLEIEPIEYKIQNKMPLLKINYDIYISSVFNIVNIFEWIEPFYNHTMKKS